MTYTATRYTRVSGRQHICPESPASMPHNLIPDPVAVQGSALYVCPYDFDQERGEASQARLNAEAEAERREKAERIAKNIPLPATWRAGVEMTPALQDEIVAYGTAAALQALTEKKN